MIYFGSVSERAPRPRLATPEELAAMKKEYVQARADLHEETLSREISLKGLKRKGAIRVSPIDEFHRLRALGIIVTLEDSN
jgi:hypothetical protein